jgi:hypothetical protein
MRNLHALLNEITELTNKIETKYPEVYKYLEENPLTIPAEEHPHIDRQVLEDYLQSLKQLLKHHLETHKNSIIQ